MQRKYLARRIIAGAIALVVVIVLAVGGYATYSYFHFTSGITHVDAIGGTAKNIDGKAQNILLVGNDQRPANMTAQQYAELHTTEDGGSSNTDTMMILHLAADGSSATVISLPRDSWVTIPGHGKGKLNAAYPYGMLNGGGDAGGAKLLVQTVENLTGLSIDHYVKVSLVGFYNIAQALGPIQVCLNQATKDAFSGADFAAGQQTLDASQALAFVRQRHGLPNGDLDREVRQQYFLSVEAHKLLSAGTLLNPAKLNKALGAISGALETDSGLNLLSLASQMHGLTGGKIRSATIPITGTPTIRYQGQAVSIVQVDTAAMPAFIQSVIGSPATTSTPKPTTQSAYDKAKAASPGTVTVTVLNGGSVNGAATQAAQSYKDAGFNIATPGNHASVDTTSIEYPKGMESEAKAAAALLPGAAVTQSSAVSAVTVVLGADGLMPGSGGSASAPSGSGAASSTPAPTPSTKSYSSASCIN